MQKITVKILQMPVRAYRLVLSPWIGNQCRFAPTCSEYAMQALERHGALKGLYLAARRLLKCHPFTRCPGHDPVPAQFEWFARRASIGYKRPSEK